ncbi:uncharacterized protein LOC128957069 [Oppia nitens]|uniref:uncharacterized protein LOC128957069 n=1 Tax=Oppia nitens TaxID=1686743 RepID=UPI0023DC902F|nr:uncharacterized protein LOC128957069 [Oppia nitens]
MLLAGLSMSLNNIINSIDKYSPPKQSTYKRRKHMVSVLNTVTNCAAMASFIAGGIGVYGSGKPSYDRLSRDYCNPILYLFAFWSLNLSFIFMTLIGCILTVGFAIKFIRTP